MNDLDSIYVNLLRVGFIVLQQAIDSGDLAWMRAEVELLHNIPSLVGEANPERHRYFWNEERVHYVDWITTHGSNDARSRMRTYYVPIWEAFEEFVVPSHSDKPV